ncbi:iron-sulfur cluster assembly scaffold protein [Kordiimonas sp. SCSIO 12603]|uniref:iron-sulfur cluster assembly scaffold protein n=1 Tax=Kordiimonas sp. SCSIO 12603 TaxID=2829596 RepID=UPI00210210D9|nr:iron-sulfur cluster assembly scaffold protein [Kordiimonas sp. SCSIO 12603]UTW58389.1 iron-sulfur cluster assembly scaffold protein [Kordiimonas sp. SCSIO 12603]
MQSYVSISYLDQIPSIMTELYNTDILRWTTRIPHTERLEGECLHVTKTSRICGSRINADAVIENGVIKEFGQEVKACALGQAAAAIVGQHVIGLEEDELSSIAEKFRHMVQTGEVNFPEKWCDLALLAPVKDHPGRHGSVMLPFEVLEGVFMAAEQA